MGLSLHGQAASLLISLHLHLGHLGVLLRLRRLRSAVGGMLGTLGSQEDTLLKRQNSPLRDHP